MELLFPFFTTLVKKALTATEALELASDLGSGGSKSNFPLKREPFEEGLVGVSGVRHCLTHSL